LYRQNFAQLDNVGERLGIVALVNAHSRLTRLGGSVLAPHVLEAMAWASQHYFDMSELQSKVSARIAELTYNEAACVTGGAAAGLVLATGACIAGKDPAKIAQLPEAPEQKNEIIVHRFQRNHYDNNVRTAGGRFVEIGNHRTTHLWELRAAIGPRTAAILHFAGPYEAQNLLPLEKVLAVASDARVPVIVDAATQIPPAENLWAFARMGADLVLFSGGKTLGGPQNTGLIVGKRELVEACVLLASPNYAIGRPMKVGKEEMIGLLAAVEFYLQRGEREQRERCENWSAALVDGLGGLQGVLPRRQLPNFKRQPLPEVVVDFDEASLGLTRDELVHRLATGDPRIEVALHGSTGITINPDPLRDGDVDIVIARLRDAISETSSPR
jgi:L-seryl-tRNA(Ser) seleniumtransferase